MKRNNPEKGGNESRTLVTVAYVLRMPFSSIDSLDKAIVTTPLTKTLYRKVSANYLRIVEE
jgi:hypothetical protein